ncbi:MAG: DUF6065 family protein [Trueperaceae bacterium]
MEETIKFFRFYRNAPNIVEADGGLLGTMPLRAAKHCEAFLSASRLGWYIYPPIGFSLMWTGNEVLFHFNEQEDWQVLDRFFLHDFVIDFLGFSPEDNQTFYPSFLDIFTEGDIVQIWTGYGVQGDEGWCYLVRSPINLAHNRDYDVMEAIVDSSWHVGPIVSNIKLRVQDKPIYFPAHKPFLQLVPIPTRILNYKKHIRGDILEPEQFDGEMWQQWRETWERRNSGVAGTYAKIARAKKASY